MARAGMALRRRYSTLYKSKRSRLPFPPARRGSDVLIPGQWRVLLSGYEALLQVVELLPPALIKSLSDRVIVQARDAVREAGFCPCFSGNRLYIRPCMSPTLLLLENDLTPQLFSWACKKCVASPTLSGYYISRVGSRGTLVWPGWTILAPDGKAIVAFECPFEEEKEDSFIERCGKIRDTGGFDMVVACFTATKFVLFMRGCQSLELHDPDFLDFSAVPGLEDFRLYLGPNEHTKTVSLFSAISGGKNEIAKRLLNNNNCTSLPLDCLGLAASKNLEMFQYMLKYKHSIRMVLPGKHLLEVARKEAKDSLKAAGFSIIEEDGLLAAQDMNGTVVLKIMSKLGVTFKDLQQALCKIGFDEDVVSEYDSASGFMVEVQGAAAPSFSDVVGIVRSTIGNRTRDQSE